VLVYVVIHPDLSFAETMSVKSPAVLTQRAFPGDGHSEEQWVEPSVDKALADVASSGEAEQFLYF